MSYTANYCAVDLHLFCLDSNEKYDYLLEKKHALLIWKYAIHPQIAFLSQEFSPLRTGRPMCPFDRLRSNLFHLVLPHKSFYDHQNKRNAQSWNWAVDTRANTVHQKKAIPRYFQNTVSPAYPVSLPSFERLHDISYWGSLQSGASQ